MSYRSPTANRSFLHRKLQSSSTKSDAPADKIVYATLDCLALKRARLPLQLVPLDSNDSNASAKTADKTDAGRKVANSGKTSSRRPSFKVRSGSSLHWKQRHKVNVVTGKFENTPKESGGNRQSLLSKNGNTSKVPYHKNVSKTVPELLNELLEPEVITSPSPELSSNSNKSEKLNSHIRKRSKTESRKQTNRESGFANHESESQSLGKLRNDDEKRSNFLLPAGLINNSSHLFTFSNEANELMETGYSTIKLPESNPLNVSERAERKENSLEKVPKKTGSTVSEVAGKLPNNRTGLKSSKLKSLSREELRNVKISEPKDFVHIASVTNPKLIVEKNRSNGGSVVNQNRISLTLPACLNADEQNRIQSMTKNWCSRNLTNGGELKNEIKASSHKYVPMSPADLSRKNVKSKTAFFDQMKSDAAATGKTEPLRRLQCTYGKVAERQESEREKVPEQLGNVTATVVKTGGNEAEEKIYELMADVPSRPTPNSSFLWSSQQMKISKSLANPVNGTTGQRISYESNKLSFEERQTSVDSNPDDEYEEYEEYDEYDHVGPSRESAEKYDYDDVGPTLVEKVIVLEGNEEDVYDDVMPPSYASIGENMSPGGARAVHSDCLTVPHPDADRFSPKIGDSMMVSTKGQLTREALLQQNDKANSENPYLSINNEYSSLEDLSCDRDVYDDVDLPHQERVNSLYAGSLSGLNSTRDESEWEDLDETLPPPLPLPLPQRNGTSTKGGEDIQLTPCKKKLGLTWSHKVRRQRSKASRRNSARSSAQNTCDHTSVDSGSDNSNYESLYSSQLDDFSSDSETEKENPEGNGLSPDKDDVYLEAPSRPTPPPPREASLTQTLGRRMKLLRRTWSLTKGSLGRIRKKSAGEHETIYSETIPKDPSAGNQVGTNTADHKKYFSFKKHFRKSVMGLSTFYLDNNENNFSVTYANDKEKIYSNGNWSSGESKSWQDDDSVQSQNSNADRCSLLAEEPLYQFYAAAAARVAFESDSDGYEEVEGLIPTQATTDLAKPGHRTLWCQTPQVVNNGLHQKLTAEERKLQEAKFEILTSEASYLSSLRVLEEEFVKNAELNSGILSPLEKEKLFGGVPGIRKASERLLADLENVWMDDPMMYGLPDVLFKHAKRSCNVYVQYCSNQVTIDTTLKELRGRKGSKFLEILFRIETHPACQSLSLHSFLMLPMQRVTRLPLLADAVLTKLGSDHPERTLWENVLASLSRVVTECNEGARAAGRQVEMEALARKLEYSPKLTPITLRDRYLIRSGPVIQLSPKTDGDYKLTFGKRLTKTSLHLFLLMDYLLVTKPKLSSHDETYTVIDICKRSLVTMESVTEDSPWAGRHAMILTLLENHMGREVEFVLTCESDTELMRWMDVISPPKSSLIGETLYESWDCPQVMAVYSYAPVQPDELALHPGDVINVLRKMADGWNHGEKLLDSEQGWFPANYTKEVASEHVRARNLKQRHRLLAVTGNLLQKRGRNSVTH
ncbi:uncharacterized protein LOC107220363 [Neodiprion lecontei]|uniref:Uncharacterized protein LOC107220363 n=1 Tax=Neodiprion lecontei TaxID=441921 RepID=A0ABM3GLZ2_NEOLC|nr:uncharacterized protein LOC107220363 [Neodiprion lecontei]